MLVFKESQLSDRKVRFDKDMMENFPKEFSPFLNVVEVILQRAVRLTCSRFRIGGYYIHRVNYQNGGVCCYIASSDSLSEKDIKDYDEYAIFIWDSPIIGELGFYGTGECYIASRRSIEPEEVLNFLQQCLSEI